MHDSGVQAALFALVLAGLIGSCVGYGWRGLCDRWEAEAAARWEKHWQNEAALDRMEAEYAARPELLRK